MELSTILIVFSVVVLFHAAYSMQHYRGLLFDLEESTGDPLYQELLQQPPPLDIWAELVVAFAILFVAELTKSGSSLQPVKGGGGQTQKPVVAPSYVTRDFDVYTSRARVFR